PVNITEAIFTELESALAPVSREYMRSLLKETGLPLDPFARGISLHGLPELRQSLLAFAELYALAKDRTRRDTVRAEVIEAKKRLRGLTAATVEPDRHREREEMLLEVMTWLENP